MPFATGYSAAEARLLMTLAGFAYVDGSQLPGEDVAGQRARMAQDINAALAASPYPTWRVVWGPGLTDDRGNMLYVAGDTASQQLAVVIRGTNWSFWLDWLEDLGSVLPLEPFTAVLPSTPSTAPMIARGTMIGLQQLTGVRAAPASGGNAVDVLSFLQQAAPGAEIFVTGHSLGGCLASVLAPWLAAHFGTPERLKVYTFAAPSAGDQGFAQYYNGLFVDMAYRVYNDLDVVPNAWASLTAIEALYTPAPRCTDEIKFVVNSGATVVGRHYQQVGTADQGSAVRLPGQVLPQLTASLGLDLHGDHQFLGEVQQQHATATYLQLLAAPTTSPAVAKLHAAHARLRG